MKTIVQVTLSDADVQAAVTDWVKQRGLFVSGAAVSVELSVRETTEGYGQGEHTVHVVQVVAKAEL